MKKNKDYYRIIDINRDFGCLECGLFSPINLDVLSSEVIEKLNELNVISKGLVFDLTDLDIKISSLVYLCKIEDEDELDEIINPTDSDLSPVKLETENSILIYDKEECT